MFTVRCVLGSVIGCFNVKPSVCMTLNHALCDVQNVCAKVGIVLKCGWKQSVDGNNLKYRNNNHVCFIEFDCFVLE